VVDRSRRELGMAPVELAASELDRAEELLDAQRLAADLDALLAELPADQREALRARIVEERDYADLAAEWSRSEAVRPPARVARPERAAQALRSGSMTRGGSPRGRASPGAIAQAAMLSGEVTR
jgi:DNA-directed RNA polymerase specialized sigma24 family protein